MDNPVFYVQYGHARIASILRKAAEAGLPPPRFDSEAVRALTLPEELDLREAHPGASRTCSPGRPWPTSRTASPSTCRRPSRPSTPYYTGGKRSGERVHRS